MIEKRIRTAVVNRIAMFFELHTCVRTITEERRIGWIVGNSLCVQVRCLCELIL